MIQNFLNDGSSIILVSNQKIKANELYDIYSKWAQDNNTSVLGKMEFNKKIEEKGYKKFKGSGNILCFEGITQSLTN